jgi:hypothetical protein
MSYCTSCGQANDNDSQFCQQCGQPLAALSTSPASSAAHQASSQIPTKIEDPQPVIAKSCPSCHAIAPEGATFCTRCGVPFVFAATGTAPPASQSLPASPTGDGGQTATFTFRTDRWSKDDRIAGISSIVILIALFLPWFGVSAGGLGVTASGLTSHGYLYIVMVVVILQVVYLLARAGWDKMPSEVSNYHRPIILISTLVDLVIVALAFALKPGTGTAASLGVHIGWRFGAFVGLAAAVVAAAPLVLPVIRSWAAQQQK